MAKPKQNEIKNRLSGETATITRDPLTRRTLITKPPSNSSQPTPKENSKIKQPKAKKPKKAEKPKAKDKVPITTSAKAEPKVETPKLKEIEQKVLDYLASLDHPATSNEVRDQFGFPLRAPARAIFRKLEKFGYGENRKVGNRYRFFVKGKEYPEPKAEEAPAKPPKKAEASAKA